MINAVPGISKYSTSLFTAWLMAGLIGFVLSFSASSSALAASTLQIALIVDGPRQQVRDLSPLFRKELEDLTSGEFDIQFREFSSDWSISGIQDAISRAYADRDIDLVLVIGFASTQVAAFRKHFPKPTFLPLLFNAEFINAPAAGNSSGLSNLNYLVDKIPFSVEVQALQRLLPFDAATIIIDSLIIDALNRSSNFLEQRHGEATLSLVGYDGKAPGLASRIAEGTKVVLLGPLPRLPQDDLISLLDELSQRGIAVISLLGHEEVELGALATDTASLDMFHIARKTALNIQAVLLGENASSQPVSLKSKRELVINMDTARKIGLSPRFDVLSEARLINAEPAPSGPAVNFRRVAEMAISRNLDLEAGRLAVKIGEADVGRARAGLLPQLSLSASITDRDSSELLRSQASPERSTDSALTLNQMLYSERVVAGYQQEKLLQQARRSDLSALELDRVAEALAAYLQALRAEIQLKIQQENLRLSKTNLDLARDRVRVGASSVADVSRWESSVANARSTVIQAYSAREQAHENLNRILDLPLEDRFLLQPASPSDPFTLSESEFDNLITNPRQFRWFAEFTVQEGIRNAPELAQLKAQEKAAERDVTAKSRSFWLPDFSLQVQYMDNLDRSGLGDGPPVEGIDDWGVSVNATLPLLSGGERRAALSRAKLTRHQLTLQERALTDRIEQNIWAGIHASQSSYSNIQLFGISAAAARRTLDLVTDGYRRGTVKVIDLLDAQTQLVQAELNANNAIHDFLLDVVDMQRSSGKFNFMMPQAAQDDFNLRLRAFIEQREAKR